MASYSEQCSCCTHTVTSPSVYQTLNEMDFERGIWTAAMDGDLQRVRNFVQKGTDPNLRDSSKYTALHYASRSGQLAVCKFLLESGACASPQTPGGATPLHRAAYCGHVEVVRLLLDHRADPQLCDDDGASPLHKAAERGQEEVCKLLLQHCPSLHIQVNKKDQLPYQLVKEGHLQELLKPSDELLQNVKQGDASVCPESDPAVPLDWSVWRDGNAKLRCVPPSNLAATRWQRANDHAGGDLAPSGRLQLLRDGLLILNATAADQGLYRCLAEERSNAGRYTTTVAQYRLLVTEGGDGRSGGGLLPEARTDGPSVAGLQAAVALLVVLLVALLAWNLHKGHLPLPWRSHRGRGGEDDQGTATDDQGAAGAAPRQEPEGQQQVGASDASAEPPESKPLMTASGGAENCSSNNNHHSNAGGGGEALQFIDEESQI